MNIYKCNATDCPFAPCYIQCDNAKSSGSIYDGDTAIEPESCPHGDYGSEFDCQWKHVEVPKLNTRYAEELNEWLCGEGWDNVPEDFRDMCVGCGIEPRGINTERAVQALRLIKEYDNGFYDYEFDRDDWQKRLEKTKKIDLLNGIFPEAFRAGMIYGEMLRQKRASGTEVGR